MKRGSGFKRPQLPPRPAYIFPSSSSPSSPGADLRAVPKKPKPIRDKAYLRFVKGKPCCVCGAQPPSDPHHERHEGRVIGAGIKAGDDTCVPLCRRDHGAWHDERAFRGMTTEQSIALMRETRARLRSEWATRG